MNKKPYEYYLSTFVFLNTEDFTLNCLCGKPHKIEPYATEPQRFKIHEFSCECGQKWYIHLRTGGKK